MSQDAKSLPLSTGTPEGMNQRDATALFIMMVAFFPLMLTASLTWALPEVWKDIWNNTQVLEIALFMLLVSILCIYAITILGLRRFPTKTKRPLLCAYCSCVGSFLMCLILSAYSGIVQTVGLALWLWIAGFIIGLVEPYVKDAFRKD